MYGKTRMDRYWKSDKGKAAKWRARLRSHGLGLSSLTPEAEAITECEICGKADGKALHIDHIEKDGKSVYRGRLCNRCNLMVGSLERFGPELLKKARKYVMERGSDDRAKGTRK